MTEITNESTHTDVVKFLMSELDLYEKQLKENPYERIDCSIGNTDTEMIILCEEHKQKLINHTTEMILNLKELIIGTVREIILAGEI